LGLSQLRASDEILLDFEGSRHVYHVVASCYLDRASREWDRVVAAGPVEALTLIAAAGNFVNGAYTGSRIVIAEKVANSLQRSCGFGSEPPTPLPTRTATPTA
jgi:hypothetical protein